MKSTKRRYSAYSGDYMSKQMSVSIKAGNCMVHLKKKKTFAMNKCIITTVQYSWLFPYSSKMLTDSQSSSQAIEINKDELK